MQRLAIAAVVFVLAASPVLGAEASAEAAAQGGPSASTPAARPRGAESTLAATPGGYIIGPEDVLTIMFWKDKEMSGDVIVRPDGKISTPLLNDVQAGGRDTEGVRADGVEGDDFIIACCSAVVAGAIVFGCREGSGWSDSSPNKTSGGFCDGFRGAVPRVIVNGGKRTTEEKKSDRD